MLGSPKPSALIDTIPDPEAIRQRLSEITREAALLRTLLRASERKAQQIQRPTRQRAAP
jgi:hypothetical protein